MGGFPVFSSGGILQVMYVTLSALVCLVGLLMYVFGNRDPARPSPHVPVIGLHMFWVGLLVFLLRIADNSFASIRIGQ